MKEKPIIFSPPMVKAILEGRKTQTRRVIKPQPDKDDDCINYCTIEGYQTSPEQADEIWAQDKDGQSIQLKPKYKRGDILWVREKWCNVNKPGIKPDYHYFADTLLSDCEDYDPKEWTWKPSIHMKREAARIFLEVVSMRVEQLQNITDADAKSEGIYEIRHNGWFHCDPATTKYPHCSLASRPRQAFMWLWDFINNKRDCSYSWLSNPWVWVIEFKVLQIKGERICTEK